MGRLPLLAVALLLCLPTAFCVKKLNSGVVIHKCCPLGQTFKTASSSECVAISNDKFTWPAKEGTDGNIHFGANDEEEGSDFNFNAKPYLDSAWTFSSEDKQRCERQGGHLSQSLGFSIEPNGHANVADQSLSNADYCLEFFGDDDESWEVVMLYCNKMERYYVPKCCKVNEILNIRSGKCEPDERGLESISDFISYKKKKGQHQDSVGQLSNLYDPEVSLFVTKAGINTETLEVNPGTDGSVNLKLKFKGTWRTYTQSSYCLDHIIDYCENCVCDEDCTDSLAHPRALIRDHEIEGGGYEKQFDMFGSHTESSTSKAIKMLGYPVSVIFLVFSMIVINKYDFRKYWIDKSIQTSLVTCLTLVYVTLICRTIGSLDTFSDYQTPGKIACTLMAITVYYFIMASFTWMTILAFHEVYKRFSDEQKSAFMRETKWTKQQSLMLAKYNMLAFGLPLVFAAIVLLVEVDAATPSCSTSHYIRPGFGEESCWFALCSLGQGVFIYIPIGLAMVSNLVMFGLCIYKMYKEEEDLFRKQEQQELLEQKETIESIEDIISADANQQTDVFDDVINKRKTDLAKEIARIRRRKVFEAIEMFIIMGLTWVFELGAFILGATNKKNPLPESAIIVMNFVNIVQGVVIFGLMAMQSKHVRGKILKSRQSDEVDFTGTAESVSK